MSRFLAIVFLICGMALAQNTSFFGSGASLLSSEQSVSARSAATLQPTYAELQVDSSYVLGPGDFLDIMLESKYLTVQIYPDGTVAIEECGAVNVGGKTLSEARELILNLVGKRYKREYCFVQLSALKRFRVNIMGAVPQLGQHSVEPQTRLSNFIRQAGNLLPNANMSDIRVYRGKDTIHVDFQKMSVDGDFNQDIMLEQGDQIFVPYIDLTDNVILLFPNWRTSVVYKEGLTIQEYYALSGAERLHNFGYKAVCVREVNKDPYWVPISDIGKVTIGPNTELEFGIQEMRVYVGGAVARLGELEYHPTWHAIDYIGAAGVNLISGSWNQIKVWRGGDVKPISINVGSDPIFPGDYIEVPKSHYESFKDFTLFIASLLTVVSSAFIIYVNYK